MLSDIEKKLCEEILAQLSDDDLFSLTSTVTNRLVDANTRQEAEKAILAFTQSIDEFFKRRKISKEILLKYMYMKGLSVPKDAEKEKLVALITQFQPIPAQCTTDITTSSAQPANLANSNSQQSVPSSSFVYSPTNVTVNINVNYNSGDETNALNTEQRNAEDFVKWFYDMLNSHNPFLSQPQREFGPQHFWESAQLFLVMNTKNSKVEDIVDGSILVSERLLKFPTETLLIFLPNISANGVKSKTDPHGLKLILACGTLHLNNECVGTFQQSFGLVRNPASPGVWKIKITCLKMDEHSALALPKLDDCSEIHAIEAHTVKVLEQSMLNNT
ncbi:hypothetical protein Btru_060774 [Bulinus truncatus]|nr:hypothetical protein Btru_060774 [Bulinus truncatus]